MSTENIVVDPEELESPPASQSEVVSPPPEDKIPPKFRGKSLDEIVDAYSELESELGRKGNEVGQLRRLTDQLLGLEEAKKRAEEKPQRKITSDDLFDDPDKSITERAREIAEERAARTDERVFHLERQLVEEAFERKHKGFREKLQDEDFINFVRGSEYRKGLIVKAAQDDWVAADELFTAYEEARSSAPAQPVSNTRQAAKQSTLVKSGGSSASGVVPRNDGKKIYSRTDLINMRINNPEEFDERYSTEFLPAYLEGRVK